MTGFEQLPIFVVESFTLILSPNVTPKYVTPADVPVFGIVITP
jgi:hypothetical protein